MKIKKLIPIVLTANLLTLPVFAYEIPKEYDWARDAVEYFLDNEMMQGVGGGDLLLGGNLTREQMAKLLVEAFLEIKDSEITEEERESSFKDVGVDDWAYKYVENFVPYMKEKSDKFNPKEYVTREEFIASLMLISGYKESNVLNRDILEDNFNDYGDVSDTYQKLLCVAVERGYMKGSGENINPKKLLTRAETCTFIYRVIESKKGNIKLELGVKKTETPIIGDATVTLEQAKEWAKMRGAHQRYIDIADIYWEYGELTGIRPEILYAQAAKETGFGKYGGRVLPEQNNWAGIKVRGATGDETYDHESFETPEDGVRAHFNHMSAYLGTEPYGEPHGRYHSVKTMPWAGTVKFLEELGGKWCPDLYYGYSINYNFIKEMQEVEIQEKGHKNDISERK